MALSSVLEVAREYTATLGIDPDSIPWLRVGSAKTLERLRNVMSNLGLNGEVRGQVLVLGPNLEDDPHTFIENWKAGVKVEFDSLKTTRAVQEKYFMSRIDAIHAKSNGLPQIRHWPKWEAVLDLGEDW